MIEIKDKKDCSGCNACYSICPKNAIKMEYDKYGFKYPIVDKSKCINCGLCDKICPILNKKEEKEKSILSYACYNKNSNERLNSSSGGIFILFAKEIIKRNGVVFGVTFDKNNKVIHDYAENENDLKKFTGSKYVQSDIGDSYRKAKNFLESDRYVLFTGTPCQIEGLKAYLKKDYDKLYTQDLICHGVPSPKVWEKYLEYRKKVDGKSPVKINFREKSDGWREFSLVLSYDVGAYKNNHRTDLFMNSFLGNTVLRDSCYNCNFKKKYRESDITLADFWGIQFLHPELDDNKGISLVILNTKKGMEIFNSVAKELNFYETNLDNAIKYNLSLITSSKMDPKREKFFNHLDNMSFDKLVKKYTSHASSLRIRLKKLMLKVLNK